MAIIRCPECGHEISDKAPFCPSCGVAIAGKVVTCPKCGFTYFSDQKECPKCHHQTEINVVPTIEPKEESYSSEEKSDIVENAAEQDSKQKVLYNKSNDYHEHVDIEEKKKTVSRYNKIIIGVVLLIALIVCGICYYFYENAKTDREQQAYEYAMTSNDPQVLQNYLNQYLDAPEEHIDSIQAHLEMLKQIDQDWTNALVSGSRSAIEQYLATHPNSPFKSIALHKIDSIDWCTAQSQNTAEAVEAYLEQHPDGEHVEDADNLIKALNSKTVQPEEKQMVASLFQGFFQSLNNRDEDALTSVINPLLTNFLGKGNATRADVVTFMHKIYKSDVSSMAWQSLGDYSINKKEVGDNQYEYIVVFSAVQNVVLTDNTSTNTKYKITAKINSEGRISEFTMNKILE